MENKYYTPTIDEFYVGFEYEECIKYDGEDIWGGRVYAVGGTCDYIKTMYENSIEKTFLRVKYLDQEDVESSGWDKSFDEPDEWFHSYKGNQEIQLYFDDKCKINNTNAVGITIYMQETIIFNGWIYNKSELKKLMKQLGL